MYAVVLLYISAANPAVNGLEPAVMSRRTADASMDAEALVEATTLDVPL